jgi:hypothetical protein
MRIEVSVRGIRKERGKLPARTTFGPLRLASPLAGPPTWGELVDASPSELVTGSGVDKPVVTGWEQPVSSVSATANQALAAATP